VLYTDGEQGDYVRPVTVVTVSTNVPAGEEPEIAVRLTDGTVRDTVAARLLPIERRADGTEHAAATGDIEYVTDSGSSSDSEDEAGAAGEQDLAGPQTGTRQGGGSYYEMLPADVRRALRFVGDIPPARPVPRGWAAGPYCATWHRVLADNPYQRPRELGARLGPTLREFMLASRLWLAALVLSTLWTAWQPAAKQELCLYWPKALPPGMELWR
jgi:hypothetical protein